MISEITVELRTKLMHGFLDHLEEEVTKAIKADKDLFVGPTKFVRKSSEDGKTITLHVGADFRLGTREEPCPAGWARYGNPNLRPGKSRK